MQNSKNAPGHNPPIRSLSENQLEVEDINPKDSSNSKHGNLLNLPNHKNDPKQPKQRVKGILKRGMSYMSPLLMIGGYGGGYGSYNMGNPASSRRSYMNQHSQQYQ